MSNLTDDTGTGSTRLDRLEIALEQIVGVSKTRVVSDNGAPSEIHVVADAERTPKQIIRDIQTVAATAGIEIDHRVVSIVQLETEKSTNGAARPPRAILDSVVVASRGGEGWVKVRVGLPNGDSHEGTAPAGRSKEGRAKAAVASVVQALSTTLEDMGATVDVDHVMIYPTGAEELVWVRGTFVERRAATSISGAAPIVDDAAAAAAAATLHAMNRLLRFAK